MQMMWLVLGETECDLQCILDTVAAWCNKWYKSHEDKDSALYTSEETLLILLFPLGGLIVKLCP